MSDSREIDCAALLEQADWVRALARHLVADAHAADDLAQDAMTAALVRPPPADQPLRRWLAGVLRNLVRQERRATMHRGAREQTASRDEAIPSSADLLERLESHRAVVDAVVRLDEPLRSAVLMRYFEGLSPGTIARRTGTPIRTVHTRLHRALARLRAELDRAHGGDRRTWLLTLLPYAVKHAGWPASATGVFLMDAKLKIGAAALAFAGVCSMLVLWRTGVGADAPTTSLEETALFAESSRANPAGSGLSEVPSTEARNAAEPTAPAMPVAVASVATRLLGRVVDTEHASVPGLRIRASSRAAGSGDAMETTTDASGAFALEGAARIDTLDVATAGWTCLFRPDLAGAAQDREIVLVVVRCIALQGRVVDDAGRALESATVAVPLPFSIRSRFDTILDGANTLSCSTATGPDGAFQLAPVPILAGVELVTTRAGYAEDRRALPGFDDLTCRIVLKPVATSPGRLVGRVIDTNEAPVEGAWVGFGDTTTRSGFDGVFTLELGVGAEISAYVPTLRAVKPGFLPAALVLTPGTYAPEGIVLQVGPPALTIAGRVLDTQGLPLAGAEVWSDEETRFGSVEIEDGGASVRVGANIEGLLRDDPWTPRARAGSDGRFEITGLLPREYRLRAFDRVHLTVATATASAGARGLEIRMSPEAVHETIAGRVTSLAGEPMAGVQVVLERPSLGGGGPADRLASRPVKTDADGRFAFERVSRAIHALVVHGEGIESTGFRRELDAADDFAHLALLVPARVHVRIDAGDAPGFDRVSLLDARGTRLPLTVDHGEHSYVMDAIDLDHGRSESFSVSELATTLVLTAKGVEVRRMPVALVRRELNTLRP